MQAVEDVKKSVTITMANRNYYHKKFMSDVALDVNGLIHWLKDFYCDQYLGGTNSKDKTKIRKCTEIKEFLEKNPPEQGQTIQSYMSRKPEASASLFRSKSLAEILGENRKSHNSHKVTWGLQKVIDTFGYKKAADDTSAALKPYKPKRRLFRGRQQYEYI